MYIYIYIHIYIYLHVYANRYMNMHANIRLQPRVFNIVIMMYFKTMAGLVTVVTPLSAWPGLIVLMLESGIYMDI
jgi:hypothetical protein